MTVEYNTTKPRRKRVVREEVVSMANRWDIGEIVDAYFLYRDDDDLVYRSRENRSELRFRIGWRVALVGLNEDGHYQPRVFVYRSKQAMVDDGCVFRGDTQYTIRGTGEYASVARELAG